MHRELSQADDLFDRPRTAGLFLLTAFLAGLLLADLWVPFTAWLSNLLGYPIPSWSSREIEGFRFAQIAAILGGARILFASLERLAEGKVGADLATAVACIAAIAMNEPVVAAEVVVIGLIGECLEVWTFGRVRRGVERLTEVFPTRCWRIRDGDEERVLTSDLKVGDIVVVKPGGEIPVDGTIIAGQSTVDLSALTGESLPQDRGVGQNVLAGSINQLGALTIEARKVASATVVGQVIEQTAKALKNKAEVERQVDRLARWFLPVLLALALLVFLLNLFWLGGPFRSESSRLAWGLAARQSLYPTLAVLVVACPCALLLATPAAVVAAVGRLAGTGVLIKGGAVLEKLAKVEAIAFDKTGTLTEAKLEVAAVVSFNGMSESELLRLTAGVERFSEHPLAKCILAKIAHGIPEASEFLAKPGAGASALVEGHRIAVGNRRMMDEEKIAISPQAIQILEASDAAGTTILLIAVDGQLAGSISLRDRIRPEAADMLAELRNSGITALAMLTGDRLSVAQAVGAELRIDQIHAELLPMQKADWLKANPQYAFIGDGINDAPAIAQAAVGLAIRSPQSDAPSDVGEVVFLGEPLTHLPMLMRLSRETLKVIRQNILIFAFGVNLVGILLVGLVWPMFFGSGEMFEKSPLVGVLYHQFGSLAVLLNSLRLLFFERQSTSTGWVNLRLAMKDFDGWIDRTFDVDHLLHEVGHNGKPISFAAVSLGFLVWILSGLTQIGADEVGILKRFGRIEAELTPGLHARFPWPIEETIKLKPAAVRSVDVGFRIAEGKPVANAIPKTDSLLVWSSAHAEDVRRVSDESLMLTGDGNLVDVLATVRYTIADPTRFITACDNPDALIRLTFESLLRERLAGEAFLDLLTIRRNRLADELMNLLKTRLAKVHPEGLGIELVGITLPDLHPPPEVVPAYHDVARAIQGRDQQINQGEAEAIRKRRRAEEDALYMLRLAEAAAHERTRQAEANRDAFLAWVKYRSLLTEAEEIELRKQVADPDHREKVRSEWLTAKRQLTEYRLSLEAVTAYLKGRDKVLIDADKLPGKRNLLLVDPELFKLAAPAPVVPVIP